MPRASWALSGRAGGRCWRRRLVCPHEARLEGAMARKELEAACGLVSCLPCLPCLPRATTLVPALEVPRSTCGSERKRAGSSRALKSAPAVRGLTRHWWMRGTWRYVVPLCEVGKQPPKVHATRAVSSYSHVRPHPPACSPHTGHRPFPGHQRAIASRTTASGRGAPFSSGHQPRSGIARSDGAEQGTRPLGRLVSSAQDAQGQAIVGEAQGLHGRPPSDILRGGPAGLAPLQAAASRR